MAAYHDVKIAIFVTSFLCSLLVHVVIDLNDVDLTKYILGLSKIRFLRPVLLEEAKGIHKGPIMHKLRLYHVSFVLCK